jgi:general secretion pathway protein E
LLVVSPALRSLVAANAPLEALRQQAVSDGMRPLRLAGALKVAEGYTTLEEVLHATPVAQG